MRRAPLRIVLVVRTVAGLAAVALLLAVLTRWQPLDPRRAVLAVTLGAALIIARRTPLPLSSTYHLRVGTAIIFAATLLLPAPLAMITVGLGALIAERSRRISWLQATFNSAALILQVGTSAAVFLTLSGVRALPELSAMRLAVAALLTAATMYAVNVALVELIIAVQQRRVVVTDLVARRRTELPGEVALYSLGLLVAMLAVTHVWAVALLAAPTVLIFRGVRATLAAQALRERAVGDERLAHLASHDELTGLANRTLLRERVAQALGEAAAQRGSCAILFLDMDNFKAVNDTLGHDAGDALLRVVAQRLRENVRPDDTVARFGGDEFIILLRQGDAAEAIRVAERLLRTIQMPVALAGHAHTLSASIGIALGGDRATIEMLLHHADRAMYRAKAGGAGRYEVHPPERAVDG